MERAIVAHQTGGPEVLQLEDRAPGAPGQGQALVRIEAAGVNFRDTYVRSGRDTGPLPYVPGGEGAGIVEQVGPGVDGLEPGMAVTWTGGPGSYATAAVLPAARLVLVPEGLSTELAAAALLQGMTAHYLAIDADDGTGRRGPGAGGGRGVGLLLTQLLKEAGATVIGTVSTAEKEKLARSLGADHVIRYDTESVLDKVLELTGGTGVEVVYYAVGVATFDDSLSSLRHRGLSRPLRRLQRTRGDTGPRSAEREGDLHHPALAHALHARPGRARMAGGRGPRPRGCGHPAGPHRRALPAGRGGGRPSRHRVPGHHGEARPGSLMPRQWSSGAGVRTAHDPEAAMRSQL